MDVEPPPLPAQRGVVLGVPELRPDPEARPPEPEKEKETGFRAERERERESGLKGIVVAF